MVFRPLMLAAGLASVSLSGVTGMAQPKEPVSTAADTEAVSLTVYNGNFGIVRERRSIDLPGGTSFFRFEDVAAMIDPTSIAIKSLTAPDALSVREQNYQYDLLNPTSLLNKSVGKRVRLRLTNADGKTEVVEGTLLNPQSVVVVPNDPYPGDGYTPPPQEQMQGLVVRLDSGRVLLNPNGPIELLEMPEGLVSRPSLLWQLDVAKAGKHTAEVSYLTNGINWKCDYVAVVNNDESKVDVTGWVTLDNRSGATYRNASLQLMAGDVRRVTDNRARYDMLEMARNEAPGSKGGFEEESFFEYHLYTLEGKTTVANNEQKQMTLLSAAGVNTNRKLVFDGARRWWLMGNYQPGASGDTTDVKLNVVLEIKNSKQNNMGMPLPKGKVRVYKADSRGGLQFLGEDLIDHTPKDETVKLYIGDAFDVKGTRKRTNYTKLGERTAEESYEINIRNHKQTDAKVWVVEHAWGDWTITKNSHPFNKTDASSFEFPITVPKDGEVTVSYTVRTTW